MSWCLGVQYTVMKAGEDCINDVVTVRKGGDENGAPSDSCSEVVVNRGASLYILLRGRAVASAVLDGDPSAGFEIGANYSSAHVANA